MLISVDNIMFEKTKLEEQLRLHKVSRDKLLRDTLGKNPKSFNNWKVKWSRLINKKPTDPGNFGLLELSELLVKYFNAMGKDNAPKLYSTYFVTKSAKIKGLGVVLPNGQIRVFKKNDHSTLMVPQWKENHSFVLLLSPPRTNLVLYFPALKPFMQFFITSWCSSMDTNTFFGGFNNPSAAICPKVLYICIDSEECKFFSIQADIQKPLIEMSLKINAALGVITGFKLIAP